MIYELLVEYRNSARHADRIVAAIFETLAELVEALAECEASARIAVQAFNETGNACPSAIGLSAERAKRALAKARGEARAAIEAIHKPTEDGRVKGIEDAAKVLDRQQTETAHYDFKMLGVAPGLGDEVRRLLVATFVDLAAEIRALK